MPGRAKLLEPLREVVCTTSVPALLGRAVSGLHWEQLVLPAREGGLWLDDAVADAPRKHATSKACTVQPPQLIVDNGF